MDTAKALRYARRIAAQTDGFYTPEELLQEATYRVIQAYGVGEAFNIQLVSTAMRTILWNWWRETESPVRCDDGGQPKKLGAREYFATETIEKYTAPVADGDTLSLTPVALQTDPQTDRMILQHDVETAIRQLPLKDQRFVTMYLQCECSLRATGVALGYEPSGVTARRQWERIQPRLRALLADYKPPRTDKTSLEKSA